MLGLCPPDTEPKASHLCIPNMLFFTLFPEFFTPHSLLNMIFSCCHSITLTSSIFHHTNWEISKTIQASFFQIRQHSPYPHHQMQNLSYSYPKPYSILPYPVNTPPPNHIQNPQTTHVPLLCPALERVRMLGHLPLYPPRHAITSQE